MVVTTRFYGLPLGMLVLLCHSPCCTATAAATAAGTAAAAAVSVLQFTPLYFGTPGAFPKSDPPLGGGYVEPWALNSVPLTPCVDGNGPSCTCSPGVSDELNRRAVYYSMSLWLPSRLFKLLKANHWASDWLLPRMYMYIYGILV